MQKWSSKVKKKLTKDGLPIENDTRSQTIGKNKPTNIFNMPKRKINRSSKQNMYRSDLTRFMRDIISKCRTSGLWLPYFVTDYQIYEMW